MPGESCKEKIEEFNIQLDTYLVAVMTGPLFLYAIVVSQSHFGGIQHHPSQIAIYVVVGIAMIAFCGWKLVRIDDKRRRYVLGRDGELATAQELNQLMLDGCRVYHDIPMDYGNIDHVVISGSGVYLVETKARRKVNDTESGHAVEVDYDAGVLRFPKHFEGKVFQQAKTNKQWLTKFLKDAVGEPVDVEAIIALPGWKVTHTGKRDRSSATGILVINPRETSKVFRPSQS